MIPTELDAQTARCIDTIRLSSRESFQVPEHSFGTCRDVHRLSFLCQKTISACQRVAFRVVSSVLFTVRAIEYSTELIIVRLSFRKTRLARVVLSHDTAVARTSSPINIIIHCSLVPAVACSWGPAKIQRYIFGSTSTPLLRHFIRFLEHFR